MRVVALDPPDFTGRPVYRIQFQILPSSSSSSNHNDNEEELVDGMIHRPYDDFVKFDAMLHERTWIFNADATSSIQLPSEEEANVDALDAYLQQVATVIPGVLTSTELADFLGINWSGADLKFLCTLPDFMQVVIPALYRAPEFAPEPPVITTEEDAITAPETPFEIYVYLMAFRARGHLADYLTFFDRFISTQPAYGGPDSTSDVDVQPPGVEVSIPVHFNQTYVHFLPGGYLNGHTVRISYLGKSKFNFLHEDLLTEWLSKLHGDKRPRRILDIGTGPGFSAFVLNQLFPEAEIVAVDLAAPYVRMARQWAGLRNATNISFYQVEKY
jgi:hypothetical protein